MGPALEPLERSALERSVDKLAPIGVRRCRKIGDRYGDLGFCHSRKMPRASAAANRPEDSSARRFGLPPRQLVDARDIRTSKRIANPSPGDDAIGRNFSKRQENECAFEQMRMWQRQI